MNSRHKRFACKCLRSPLNPFAAFLLAALAGSLICPLAQSQSLLPLSGFGSNGRLAPGSPYLSIASAERDIAWDPISKSLVLPSRSSGTNVAILDGATGSVLRTLNTTGVLGGTLPILGTGVSADGRVFVCNLQSGSNSLIPFKVYGWTSVNDTGAPSVVFSQVNPITINGGWRFGDAFDVYGSGTNARFAAAGSTAGTSSVTGVSLPNNGNFMIGTLDGSNVNTIYRNIPGTFTNSNDYRLGLTFVDADTIIGSQGGSAKITDFVAAPTLTNTGATITAAIAIGAADRPLDYTVLGGRSLLATVSTTTSTISIYDITDPQAAQLLATNTTTSGTLTSNGNGSGGLQWGETVDSTS